MDSGPSNNDTSTFRQRELARDLRSLLFELKELRYVREEMIRLAQQTGTIAALREGLLRLARASTQAAPGDLFPISGSRDAKDGKAPWCEYEEELWQEQSVVGSVVRLISGGPAMTVRSFDRESGKLEVCWFDKAGSIHRGVFQREETFPIYVPGWHSDAAKDALDGDDGDDGDDDDDG